MAVTAVVGGKVFNVKPHPCRRLLRSLYGRGPSVSSRVSSGLTRKQEVGMRNQDLHRSVPSCVLFYALPQGGR